MFVKMESDGKYEVTHLGNTSALSTNLKIMHACDRAILKLIHMCSTRHGLKGL